jgi:hypothetical protein
MKRSSKMLSRILLSSVIVLLVSTGASAGIIQLQGYTIGTANGIDLLRGHQSGQGSNTVVVNNNQWAETTSGTWAQQSQSGQLNQIGSAQGDVAAVSVDHIFDNYAGQAQTIGGWTTNPMLMRLNLGLVGTHLIGKTSRLALLIGFAGARF